MAIAIKCYYVFHRRWSSVSDNPVVPAVQNEPFVSTTEDESEKTLAASPGDLDGVTVARGLDDTSNKNLAELAGASADAIRPLQGRFALVAKLGKGGRGEGGGQWGRAGECGRVGGSKVCRGPSKDKSQPGISFSETAKFTLIP